MDKKSEFVHVGLTVSNIDATVDFYTKYFGFECVHKGVFNEKFIGNKPTLYRQPEGTYSDFAFLKSPDGIPLELFQFNTNLPAVDSIWNRPGYHHICLRVACCMDVYNAMAADGLADNYFFVPDNMDPEGKHHWVFLKDPDGNMIELQD